MGSNARSDVQAPNCGGEVKNQLKLRATQKEYFLSIKRDLKKRDKIIKNISKPRRKFSKIDEDCLELWLLHQSLAFAMTVLDMIEDELPKKFRTKRK